MRADGEVDKEQFKSLKSEIDMKIHTLKEQIAAFMPEEDESEEMPVYDERLMLLAMFWNAV